MEIFSENKFFWKTVESFYSNNIVSREQITLIEKAQIILEDSYVAQSLNFFFSNIVINFKITEYTDNNSNFKNITSPIIKFILKYRNHSNILTIGEVCKERSTSPFPFSEICKEKLLRDILNLDASKTCN